MLNSATAILDPVFFSEATKARKAFRTSLVAFELAIDPDSSMIIRTSRPHALVRSGLGLGVVDSRAPRPRGVGRARRRRPIAPRARLRFAYDDLAASRTGYP